PSTKDKNASVPQFKSLNLEHMGRVQEAWDFIMLDEFQNISSREPLSLAEGGSAVPVDLLVIKNRLQQCPGSWSVTGGGNAAWVNWHWTVNQVPILESGVSFLRDAKFREPMPLKVTVV
ncbi:unnamed protein product, partial [Effrenium voratum]